jgi:hypothetical protein
MANRLIKQARITYAVGTPHVPAVPAVCFYTTIGTYQPILYVTSAGEVIIVGQKWVEKQVATCYPERPGTPAVAPYIGVDGLIGWNAGGHSLVSFSGDIGLSFELASLTASTVAGIGPGGADTNPATITHGFHVSNGVVSVWESGQLVAEAPAPYSGGALEITRFGGTVTLRFDGWEYVSSTPSDGEVVLDAALFVAGDFIDDPIITGIASGGASLELTGAGADAAQLQYGSASLDLTGYGSGLTGNSGTGGASIQLDGMGASVRGAAYGGASLELTGDGLGGSPLPAFAYGGTVLELSGIGFGMTGNAGNGGASLLLDGAGADALGAAYGGGSLELTGSGLGGAAETGGYSYLVMSSRGDPSAGVVAGGYSGLDLETLGSPVVPVVAGDYSGLLLASSGDPVSVITVGGFSGLVLESFGGPLAQVYQLLMNLATGAMSEATGLDFDGFVQTPSGTYGWNRSGLYLIETPEVGRDVLIDTGASDLGNVQQKNVQTLWVACDTDCSAPTVEASTAGQSFTYAMTPLTDEARVNIGRGLIGKEWRFTLRYPNTKQFRFDGLTMEVRDSQRVRR